MKDKKVIVRVVAILLVVVLVGGIVLGVLGSTAGAVTQSEIDSLKSDLSKISQQKKEISAKLNSLEYSQSSALAKKEVLDEQVELTQKEIDNISRQIEEYTNLIAEKETEIVECQRREDEQMELYKERIRAMEENGTISYFEIIFGATSFANMLSRIDFISEVMSYDEEVYNGLVEAKNATVQAKTDLEDAKAQQETQKTALEGKRTELLAQVDEASKMLEEIESALETYNALMDEAEAEEESVQNDIEKKVEQLKKQQQQTGGGVVGTGTFKWPSASSSYITSTYGMRMHPIYHQYRKHSGIDIGASYGTNIYAADSGTVITATYSSSYGYYIMIYHGNGYTTLYAHSSKLLVSSGDKVSKGDVIALVGSTGNSTGAHLHFEVRYNGSTVNPLDYFDSSTYTIKSGA